MIKVIIILLAAVFVFSSPFTAYSFEKGCEFCHTSHMGSGTLLNEDVNELCSGCHQERLQKGEHKVGMSPSMVVRDLPLYSGKMACPTCHDPHSKTPSMLRKPARELCCSCHDK